MTRLFREIWQNTKVGTTIVLFWNIGQRINHEVLNNKRADYGKQIAGSA